MTNNTDDTLNDDPDENRAMAAALVSTLRDLQGTLLEVATGIGKWILTSLLAINGGAAIAAWQSALPSDFKIAACGTFISGVLAALVCGALQVRHISGMAKPLGSAIGYWISVQVDGLRCAELENFEEITALAKKTKLVWVAGGLSALLFLGGVFVAGVGSSEAASEKPDANSVGDGTNVKSVDQLLVVPTPSR